MLLNLNKKNILVKIILKSNNYIILKNYINKIYNNLLLNLKCNKFNSIKLPIKRKKITILRSPHIFKKSSESFEEKIFSSLLNITFNNYKEYLNFIYKLYFLKNNIFLTINIILKINK